MGAEPWINCLHVCRRHNFPDTSYPSNVHSHDSYATGTKNKLVSGHHFSNYFPDWRLVLSLFHNFPLFSNQKGNLLKTRISCSHVMHDITKIKNMYLRWNPVRKTMGFGMLSKSKQRYINYWVDSCEEWKWPRFSTHCQAGKKSTRKPDAYL